MTLAAADPALVSYGALAVAFLAFAFSVATYFRSGPLVRARVQLDLISPDTPEADLTIVIYLSNVGLAPKEIHRFSGFFSAASMELKSVRFETGDTYEGEQLPYKLEGGSTRKFVISLRKPVNRLIAANDIAIAPKLTDIIKSIDISIFSLYNLLPAVGIIIDLGSTSLEKRLRFAALWRVRRFVRELQAASAPPSGPPSAGS